MTTSRAPPRRPRRQRALLEEGAREREHDQRDRRRAQASSSQWRMRRRRTDWYGNALQEHQRRKLDDALPLALNQMHEYRNGDGAEGDEEEGVRKDISGL